MQRDYTAPPSQVSIIKGKAVHLRNFWVAKASASFPLLSSAAQWLLSIHITTAAAHHSSCTPQQLHTTAAAHNSNSSWSFWGQLYQSQRNQLGIEKSEKMVFINANIDDVDAGVL